MFDFLKSATKPRTRSRRLIIYSSKILHGDYPIKVVGVDARFNRQSLNGNHYGSRKKEKKKAKLEVPFILKIP